MPGPRRQQGKTRPAPASYRQRTYRHAVQAAGLVASFVTVRETDLHILAATRVEDQAYDAVYRYRNQLENYLARRPEFLTALAPLPSDPLAPPIVREMLTAARAAGVGPMAAVAGAIAEFVGKELLAAGTAEIIIENGGDIFLHRSRECLVSIFAGQSPLSQRVGIRVPVAQMPLGVCTSSGAVGHSLSLGKADSVTVLARSTPLADAVATRLGNEVSTQGDIQRALETVQSFSDILGAVIILGNRLGAWGAVDLVGIN
jgi:ApbE superfamily uncharacterized protein (UPF0280 family)